MAAQILQQPGMANVGIGNEIKSNKSSFSEITHWMLYNTIASDFEHLQMKGKESSSLFPQTKCRNSWTIGDKLQKYGTHYYKIPHSLFVTYNKMRRYYRNATEHRSHGNFK